MADRVVYWDSSAALSALFSDAHSDAAMAESRRAGVHLISTLAWAEVHAVIARAERQRRLARALADVAREALETGPWRRVNAGPDWQLARDLARKWPLRGADLWHLATAKGLQVQLPELTLFSFDDRLVKAARAEGLA